MLGSPTRDHSGRRAGWGAVDVLIAVGLLCWLVFFAVVRHPHGDSWPFFTDGAHVLLSSGWTGWVHLFADQPKLQVGPVALLAAVPFAALPPVVARYTAITLMTALGIPLFVLLCSLARPVTRWRRVRTTLAGALAAPVWVEVATRAGHLDDVLALALAVTALAARLRGRYLLTALLAAAAADCKPWALAFAPLLLDRDRPLRDQLRPVALYAAAIAVAWAPFVLGDPNTVRAARFTIRTSPASALRALGIHAHRTPRWDRPAQIVLGAVVAAVAVFRRRPGAVLLVGVCVRLLLDPQIYPYYTAGLLVGAVAYDLVATRSPVPIASITAVVAVYLPQYLVLGHQVAGHPGYVVSSDLRAAFCLVAIAVALVLPREPGPPAIPRRRVGLPHRSGLTGSEPSDPVATRP